MTAPCTVRLPVFEGPLDLLLHLIKKNEVQITDIPIATITDQYLAMLEQLPELNLDNAGEYLVMAATLMVIKSRMLLPPSEDEEPEEDPRAELVQQLVEYQRFREVAVALGDRHVLARDVFAAPGEPLGATAPGAEGPAVREASLGDLLDALRGVLHRIRRAAEHEIPAEPISLRACVQRLLAQFAVADRIDFGALFPPEAGRADIIVSFIALLELIRLRLVRARQEERFGPITLELATASVADAVARIDELARFEFDWGGGEEDDGHGVARDR